MRLLLVGESSPELAGSLEREGVELLSPPRVDSGGEDEVALLAAGLRAFETLLSADPVDGAGLAGSSPEALAALLVAIRLQIPVAAIAGRPASGSTERLNHGLIARLADATLAEDATEIAAWLRGIRPRSGRKRP